MTPEAPSIQCSAQYVTGGDLIPLCDSENLKHKSLQYFSFFLAQELLLLHPPQPATRKPSALSQLPTMATKHTIPTTVTLNSISNSDHDKHRSRQSHATTISNSRRKNQRALDAQSRALWHADAELVVMPKYRRDQEDYVNPHLQPHEQPALPPRWVGDAVPQHSMPMGSRCRCSWCTKSKASQKLDTERGLQNGLKRVTADSRGFYRRPNCPDWDWSYFDTRAEFRADLDVYLQYESARLRAADKPASSTVQVDLLAIAKPAKPKRRTANRLNSVPTRKLSMVQSELDGASFIDHEEAWDWLEEGNTDPNGSHFGEDERRSEWDWDRCSEV
ncbi:hypothetical protein FRC14_004739 [Serendipita sp. 396]|nr:hypothetical protein FRC14_004739 [Serendipita sp. 396]KAG8789380.1 hypothetical protein FRC15_009432 [Serendipita sp. 397]KAG8804612.1 hypothetical protein FRC16_006054 [Serendipita sp. 398]KAG8878734.1 hypothetical protein FRC20_006411 [Serendipita sp. 405]